jgi:GxxExxY protein
MLLFPEESYAILGACFEVYNNRGCGFLEAVYQECLQIELRHRGIPFEAQVPIPMTYRGELLSTFYRADLICFGKILVEIKAVSKLCDEHRAQALNYLSATGLELALLINFGCHPRVDYERLANTRKR